MISKVDRVRTNDVYISHKDNLQKDSEQKQLRYLLLESEAGSGGKECKLLFAFEFYLYICFEVFKKIYVT